MELALKTTYLLGNASPAVLPGAGAAAGAGGADFSITARRQRESDARASLACSAVGLARRNNMEVREEHNIENDWKTAAHHQKHLQYEWTSLKNTCKQHKQESHGGFTHHPTPCDSHILHTNLENPFKCTEILL